LVGARNSAQRSNPLGLDRPVASGAETDERLYATVIRPSEVMHLQLAPHPLELILRQSALATAPPIAVEGELPVAATLVTPVRGTPGSFMAFSMRLIFGARDHVTVPVLLADRADS
jgi:hypothetical protein